MFLYQRVPGWWLTYPSEKYEFVSWGYYSQYMESHKIHVSNHQPEKFHHEWTLKVFHPASLWVHDAGPLWPFAPLPPATFRDLKSCMKIQNVDPGWCMCIYIIYLYLFVCSYCFQPSADGAAVPALFAVLPRLTMWTSNGKIGSISP